MYLPKRHNTLQARIEDLLKYIVVFKKFWKKIKLTIFENTSNNILTHT